MPDEFRRLIEITSRAPNNMIEEIEAFPAHINHQIDEAEQRFLETNQHQFISVTLILTCVDMDELERELGRLQKLFNKRR